MGQTCPFLNVCQVCQFAWLETIFAGKELNHAARIKCRIESATLMCMWWLNDVYGPSSVWTLIRLGRVIGVLVWIILCAFPLKKERVLKEQK